MNLVQAIESVRLFIVKGTSPSYPRLVNFLGQLQEEALKRNKDLVFTPNEKDSKMLQFYLYRTYRKRVFTPIEDKLLNTVQTVLKSEESVNLYLTYAKIPMLLHAKLFMKYAQSEKEFETLAKFVINSNKNLEIATLNDT